MPSVHLLEAGILPKIAPKIAIFSIQIRRWAFIRACVFIRDFTVNIVTMIKISILKTVQADFPMMMLI